jgi:hypothetical protein
MADHPFAVIAVRFVHSREKSTTASAASGEFS